ncbi:hypothetical protein [Vulcanibacillus modesticaldus]|uniref:hypothetical protein n=1 Tax=Vulcanibacillus modesticaldus TaxID=337097 RepID=UPI00114D1822|nr:hypothetical protein [Vulcanibacillus modesticaldus]
MSGLIMEITAGLVFKVASILALIVSIMLLIFKQKSVIEIDLHLIIIFIFGSLTSTFMAFSK